MSGCKGATRARHAEFVSLRLGACAWPDSNFGGSRRSVAELGQLVGYKSEEAFSGAFKREFGLSPVQWKCPFCGRPGSAVSHQAAPNVSVTYSMGCWQDLSPFAPEPFWEDCLGPQTVWTPHLDQAVALWNWRPSKGGGMA